ncbi:MAG: nucleotidyltransferase domain-containing protein [Thermodesulfobacteriota bacterium]
MRDLCRKQPAIVAAYLFGSVAAGRSKPSSDLDLAFLLSLPAADAFPLLSFISALEHLCRCPVDVVVLNRAGEVLKCQVRKSGRLIFERDPERRKVFQVRSRKSYEDFLYLHRRYVKAVLYRHQG